MSDETTPVEVANVEAPEKDGEKGTEKSGTPTTEMEVGFLFLFLFMRHAHPFSSSSNLYKMKGRGSENSKPLVLKRPPRRLLAPQRCSQMTMRWSLR